jgi:hypothetical protein
VLLLPLDSVDTEEEEEEERIEAGFSRKLDVAGI